MKRIINLPEEVREENQKDIDIIESEKIEPFGGYYQKYSPKQLLLQFKDSKTFPKQGDLIPFKQYHTLLERYINNPFVARIPDDIVTNGITIIYRNLAQIISITRLFGRGIDFPYEVVEEFYNIKPEENQEKRLSNCIEALSTSYFYLWTFLPERNPSGNDRGFIKVYTILKEYNENMDPESKLILIDRCLNVIHGRGNMAQYFIEGGRESLDKIRDL